MKVKRGYRYLSVFVAGNLYLPAIVVTLPFLKIGKSYETQGF